MQLIRDRRVPARGTDEFRRIVTVNESVCYDLLYSLRVLYNARSFPRLRRWATNTRAAMPEPLYAEGAFFFQGHDSGVGLGAMRFIPELPPAAGPSALISAMRKTDSRDLALDLLESSGELPPDRLDAFRRLLTSGVSESKLASVLRGLPAARREHFKVVLTDPADVQKRLTGLLEAYHKTIFVRLIPDLRAPLAEAAATALKTLDVMSTVDAIERVTGGYTISSELPLRKITLAPSVFVYPYTGVRLDERRGQALIVYGAPSTLAGANDPAPVDATLVRALKALAGENRLRLFRLVVQKPRYGTEVVELLGLSQPTIHHHVAQLSAAGLIRQERTRNGLLLTVRQEGIDRLRKEVDMLLQQDAVLGPAARAVRARGSER
jgi:DNA-binding transcriptional ArsR family regulator